MTRFGARLRAFGALRRRRTPALGFILLTMLLDALAIGIAIPVLPPLVQSFRQGNAAGAAETLALFGSLFAAMTFLGSPFLGVLSDSVGRRPVLLAGLAALGFDYLVMGLAPNLGWLFVGRIVSGLAGATGIVANAYIADALPPDARAGAYAWGGAVWGFSFVLGPAAGGWLGQYDLRAPFWCAAALTMLSALYGAFVLPESLSPARRTPFRLSRASPFGAFALLRTTPGLGAHAGVNLLRWLAHAALATLMVLYIGDRFGLGPAWAGAAVALYGAFDILVQSLLVRPAIAWVGERGTMLAGLACGCLALAVLGLAPGPWTFAAGLPLLALVDLFGPGFMAIATRAVSPSAQGRVQGAITAVQTAAQVAGPLLFGFTYASLEGGAHPRLPGASFLIAAAVFALALALAAWARSPPPHAG